MYHAGFSHGFNVAEAVNLATVDWFEYNKVALKDYALDEFSKKATFTHEWLILQNMRKIDELNFTPEARAAVSNYFSFWGLS